MTSSCPGSSFHIINSIVLLFKNTKQSCTKWQCRKRQVDLHTHTGLYTGKRQLYSSTCYIGHKHTVEVAYSIRSLKAVKFDLENHSVECCTNRFLVSHLRTAFCACLERSVVRHVLNISNESVNPWSIDRSKVRSLTVTHMMLRISRIWGLASCLWCFHGSTVAEVKFWSVL